MRATILWLVLGTSICAVGQNPSQEGHPKKVLTPNQAMYQQQMKVYYAKMADIRAAAKTAFDAETAREKAGDCPKATTTVDINECLTYEDAVTEGNYRAFAEAIRSMLALPLPTMVGEGAPAVGPSGREATPATDTAAFDAAESAWQAYAKAECSAVDVHWRGGTIVGAMVGGCHLHLVRHRMDGLASDYMGILE